MVLKFISHFLHFKNKRALEFQVLNIIFLKYRGLCSLTSFQERHRTTQKRWLCYINRLLLLVLLRRGPTLQRLDIFCLSRDETRTRLLEPKIENMLTLYTLQPKIQVLQNRLIKGRPTSNSLPLNLKRSCCLFIKSLTS